MKLFCSLILIGINDVLVGDEHLQTWDSFGQLKLDNIARACCQSVIAVREISAIHVYSANTNIYITDTNRPPHDLSL